MKLLVFTLLLVGAWYYLKERPEVAPQGSLYALALPLAGMLCLGFSLCFATAFVAWLATWMSLASDSQMDAWFKELVDNTIRESSKKLNLVEDDLTRDPLTLLGICFDQSVVPEEDYLWRYGKDGFTRFTPVTITVLQFTDRHLGAYSAVLNFIREVQLKEETDEFFYRDVVSVTTRRESSARELYGEKMEQSLEFSLSVSSGDKITQTIPVGRLSAFLDTVAVPAEQAVSNIRQMLREKKQ